MQAQSIVATVAPLSLFIYVKPHSAAAAACPLNNPPVSSHRRTIVAEVVSEHPASSLDLKESIQHDYILYIDAMSCM